MNWNAHPLHIYNRAHTNKCPKRHDQENDSVKITHIERRAQKRKIGCEGKTDPLITFLILNSLGVSALWALKLLWDRLVELGLARVEQLD